MGVAARHRDKEKVAGVGCPARHHGVAGVVKVGECAGAGGLAEAGVVVGRGVNFEEGSGAEFELGCKALVLLKRGADRWFGCGGVGCGLGRI